MEYHKKTQKLIDEMIALAERKDFELDKEKAQETILKTYDLFDLPRPKEIVWFDDLTEKFLDSAYSAYRASSASSAFSASSASSASRAYRASSAFSASSAYRASSAFSASSAYSAYSASRASSASSASRASIDYDFEWFVLVYEYSLAKQDGNENDEKYLRYCESLLTAKKLGLGYWCDFDDILYLVPVPIISLDSQQRYHSTEKPAIYWKNGEENYYIKGVRFEKDLWQKITKDQLSAKEVFDIKNTEQRRIAYELMDKRKMLDLKDYKVLDEVKDDGFGYGMKVISFNVDGFSQPFVYFNCYCPTTGREYFLQTDKSNCIEAKASSF